MTGKLGDLSEVEKRVYECKGCKSSDHLYRDSHGVFCRTCGPTVWVLLKTPQLTCR